MKKTRNLLLPIFLLTLSLSACGNSGSDKKVEAEKVVTIPKDASSDSISKKLDATPSSQEINENSGLSADNYENSTFAGYDGKLSFYYNEDGSVLYYKWFINEKDEDKAKEIYSDVCQALSGSYGDGEENNSESSGLYTTSFTNDKQQITAQLQKANDSGYEISYMVVG